VAMIKRTREREKLQEIFEAKLRYEKSRKYIQKKHEKLLQQRNNRDVTYQYNNSNPYDDPLESSRDQLYLIIPTNPSKKPRHK
jgi:hypothetical protein